MSNDKKPKSIIDMLIDALGEVVDKHVEEAKAAIQESRVQILRFTEGQPEIQCPFCQQWLEAKVSDVGLPVAHADSKQLHVLEFMVPLRLCTHDHECTSAGDQLKDAVDLTEFLRKGSGERSA